MLGTVLYCLVPWTGSIGSVALFVLCFVVIICMYGGGFATVPAYLEDMFGTRYVGAIHGWLITAWSAAGVFGPVLVNYIRQYQIDHGVPKAQAYNVTMYIMAGLLVIGFICNLLSRRSITRYHMCPMRKRRRERAVGAAANGRSIRRATWKPPLAAASSIGSHSGLAASEFRSASACGRFGEGDDAVVTARSVSPQTQTARPPGRAVLLSVFPGKLRDLFLQMREHRGERFGVHLGLELVAVLERRRPSAPQAAR